MPFANRVADASIAPQRWSRPFVSPLCFGYECLPLAGLRLSDTCDPDLCRDGASDPDRSLSRSPDTNCTDTGGVQIRIGEMANVSRTARLFFCLSRSRAAIVLEAVIRHVAYAATREATLGERLFFKSWRQSERMISNSW